MSIRSVGSSIPDQVGLDQHQQDNLQKTNASNVSSTGSEVRNDVMRDVAMRTSLEKPASSTPQTVRPSANDFQALKFREQANALTSAPSAAKPTTSSVDITKSKGFQQLSQPQQKLVKDTIAKNPGVKDISDQLNKLVNDSRFTKLSTSNRTYMLNSVAKYPAARSEDLLAFSTTNSFKGFMSSQRQQGLMIMGLLSADATQNPSHNPITRNTVDLLASGNVNMGLPTKKELKEEGFTDADLQGLYGFAYDNIMNFNVYMPGLLDNKEDLIRTATHEVNHVVNDRDLAASESVTVDAALDEYRAWYVENASVGQPTPTVEFEQGVWQNFFGPNAGYDNIRQVYLGDPNFKKIADQIKTDLDHGKVTDPETFRKSLTSLIGKSKFIENPVYLQRPGNLDNHKPTAPSRT